MEASEKGRENCKGGMEGMGRKIIAHLTITSMSITVQSITWSTATLIATSSVVTDPCTATITGSTLIDICDIRIA